mmetsp:Transcript_17567/g.42240  ORF Transcript_17567/g.42240 Transcript_17567/m.42240 type:complete len:216 (+) Transcript_17567:198-845(+)
MHTGGAGHARHDGTVVFDDSCHHQVAVHVGLGFGPSPAPAAAPPRRGSSLPHAAALGHERGMKARARIELITLFPLIIARCSGCIRIFAGARGGTVVVVVIARAAGGGPTAAAAGGGAAPSRAGGAAMARIAPGARCGVVVVRGGVSGGRGPIAEGIFAVSASSVCIRVIELDTASLTPTMPTSRRPSAVRRTAQASGGGGASAVGGTTQAARQR